MEYDKINNLLLSEDNESEVSIANRANEMSKNYLNLLLENMLDLIVYLMRITKINQLDLKHPC